MNDCYQPNHNNPKGYYECMLLVDQKNLETRNPLINQLGYCEVQFNDCEDMCGKTFDDSSKK